MDPRTTALAQLTADVGIAVRVGQAVLIGASVGQEDLARALALACYERGADHVEVEYRDPYIRRIRLLYAREQALGDVVPWVRRRLPELEQIDGAYIAIAGPAHPGLMDDVDPARLGRDQVPLPEGAQVITRQRIQWTVIPGPTVGWGRLVFGEHELDPLDALWDRIAYVCRLDADDPAAAWRGRAAELAAIAERLTRAELDSLHFRGPGTNLTVGLLRGVRWAGGGLTTNGGVDHLPNLPTEEVFTSPDPTRTDGVATSTKPLLVDDRLIDGLRIRFERGRAVQVDADQGAEIVRELIGADADAARLGEVALVDAEGRVGQTDTVYHETLLDENAASHLAVGAGFPFLADKSSAGSINVSGVHTDFMIGGPSVDVTAVTRDGRKLDVLIGGRWALG